MALVRFNPFTPRFPTFFRDFDELFREVAPVLNNDELRADQVFSPPADVVETDKAVEITLDLPGVTPENIDVKVEGNLLTISAERQTEEKTEGKGWVRQERSYGKYARSFTLPNTLDGTKPDASYKHGVLKVTLPKKDEVQPRSLKIKVES